VDAQGKTHQLDAVRTHEYLGLYFCASWSQPCQEFTPDLLNIYNQLNTDSKKQMEILICPAEREKNGLKSLLEMYPWKSIPADDPRAEVLPHRFKLKKLPCLAIIDSKTGVIVRNEAENCIMMEPNGFPWGPKALYEMTPLWADLVNTSPVCLAVFDKEDKDAMIDQYRTLAEDYKKKFDAEKKGPNDDVPLNFFWARPEKHPVLSVVLKFFGLPQSSPFLCVLDLPSDYKYFPAKMDLSRDSIKAFADGYLTNKNALLKQEIKRHRVQGQQVGPQ
jgi:hypothetical protein